MTVKGGSRPACAACRFQRRRCSSDCPLAPYFPANQPKIFHNVHRLYGVGNVMKILNQVKNNEQKEESMKSIKYESYIRQIFPAKGCYGVIVQLHQQVLETTQELQHVLRLLDMYKKTKHPKQEPFELPSFENHDEVVGGCSWLPRMNDLGFCSSFYNVDEVLTRGYGWDDHAKTSVDNAENRSQIDEYLVCDDEQDEGRTDYEIERSLRIEKI